jgi:nucleotide-binding universal stress UspA family protein
MKNILILTDFSLNAMHAAQTGTMLAKQLHANILLFNSNTTQPVTSVYASGPTVIDEFNFMEEENNAKLMKLADSLKPFVEDVDGPWKPSINIEEGLGALAYQVRNITEAKDIELIVMGAREGSRMDHFLTGSETFSVIDHVSRPVLVIPYDTKLNNLRKVVFATDFKDSDIPAIQYLVKLGIIFNYHLEVVHINSLGDDDITKELRKSEFMKHVHKLRYPNMDVKEIHGEDITTRLNRLCEETGSGLLAFTHYRNSFLSRLFHQSTTRKALEKQKVPMLIFPAKFSL